jgi:hypothetical protein
VRHLSVDEEPVYCFSSRAGIALLIPLACSVSSIQVPIRSCGAVPVALLLGEYNLEYNIDPDDGQTTSIRRSKNIIVCI